MVLTPDVEYVFRVSLTPGQGDSILQEGYIRFTSDDGELIVPLDQASSILSSPLYQYEFSFTPSELISLNEVVVNVAPVEAEQPARQNLKFNSQQSTGLF